MAEYAFGYGEPGAGWQPLVGDWNGNGACGIGLYDPSSSTFYLSDRLSSGYAEHVVQFGQPESAWLPLVGCWTTEDGQSPTTALASEAVDQLDLGALALQELGRTTPLDGLDTGEEGERGL